MKIAADNHVTLSGKIDKVIFSNPENGYTVLQLLPQSKEEDKITVVGHFSTTFGTQQVTFHGRWQEHPLHGKQFLALICEQISPHLPIEKFLVEYIDGVGPSYAKKLTQAFGDDLTHILNETPARLKEVPGVGEQRFKQIMTSWKRQRANHEVILFLTTHGLHFSQAAKVSKRYGPHTIEKIENNPYCLFEDIDGVGFQTADNLALKLGFSLEDPRRLQGALIYLLQQATRDGHCGLQREKLVYKAMQLLNVGKEPLMAQACAGSEKGAMILDNIRGEPCLFLPLLWQQEQVIAQGLKKLLSVPLDIKQDMLEKILNQIIETEKLPLTTEQQAALTAALQAKVFVLTGGPGVGKTTLIKILVQFFMKQKMSLALAAPTGRAAKRISESTGYPAKTIHRLLEYDPVSGRFVHHAKMPLPYDVIVIDESSMLDVPLCAAIVQALGDHARLIFVGDIDQLAAVGPGDVLKSLIASGKIPYFSLKTIFRQAASSQIVVNAHRVNQGLMPQVDRNSVRDFFLIKVPVKEQQQKIIDIVTNRLAQRFGFDPLNDIQVLSPMNAGPVGVDNLNLVLQQTLNPPDPYKTEMKHLGGVLRVDDKVIQILNNYDKNVFNGDVGRIVSIDLSQRKFFVIFDKIKIEYQFKELEQLRLAYAISVHKSQGSEYPAVVVVLSMAQRIMLKRNLLYTAITRGKSCVVVIGEPEALCCAINRGETTKRVNKLEEWLRND